jgi:hypothetical protein
VCSILFTIYYHYLLVALPRMVNAAQFRRCDVGMLDVAHVRREPPCLIKASP